MIIQVAYENIDGYDSYEVECDNACGATMVIDMYWYDMIQKLKDSCWQIKKVGDNWEHYCPECSQH